MNKKEKLIRYLYKKVALEPQYGVKIPKKYKTKETRESITYLFGISTRGWYLTPAGVNIYWLMKSKKKNRI